MLQDSYIIAPLVWCMIKVDITQNQTMERGILWLTLAAFIWLAWQGGMSIKGGSLSQLGTAVERAGTISMRC